MNLKASSDPTKRMGQKIKKSIRDMWAIRCTICCNSIYYAKIEGISGFKLVSIDYHHLHTEDPNKYFSFLGSI